MPILHPWTDERPEDQVETWEVIRQLDKGPISVISRKMTDDESYYRFLVDHWDTIAPIVIIEQDNVPTLEQVAELYYCPFEACCFPYLLKNGQWSVQGYLDETPFYVDATPPFPEFLPGSGFGTTKIGWNLRTQIDFARYPAYAKASDQEAKRHWSNVDYWFSLRLQEIGKAWHVHKGTVKHNHVGV